MEVCGLVEVVSTPEEDLWLVGLGGGNQGGEPSLQEFLWFRHLTETVLLSRYLNMRTRLFFGIDL